MKCPACKAEIPDDSTFCLSCGRPLKVEGIDMILPPDGSKTEERATLYMMFAIMCLFFGIFLVIPGIFVGLGLIIPALGLVALGIILLLARYAVLRRYASKVEELRKESAIRVRCRYCGGLNAQDAEKCLTCGAPLV
jgi:RNA polymerase subunit RPABC4/transcription elongation factor Spt4